MCIFPFLRTPSHWMLLTACMLLQITVLAQADPKPVAADAIQIRTDFPGGNAAVSRIEEGIARVAPDLRGDSDWFYWYFEVQAKTPGRVTFVFPPTVAKFRDGAIGFQGPAISTDDGKTWQWMGTENGRGSSFFYDFTRAGETVRFSSSIPYLQSDFDAFLSKHPGNAHLTKSVLAKSRAGREVELITVGKEGAGIRPVLITCRHHANESVASFVLEGFLEEMISDSAAAKAFRAKHIAYVIPFVDKDGVEKGDQGKNRKPHDHNRDYGEPSLYPEIIAIKQLDEDKDFKFTFDIHCPTLVMDIHQRMYFTGIIEPPKNNGANLTAFAKQIKDRMPAGAPHGPVMLAKPAPDKRPMNSHYFGFKPGMVLVATLEVPFAPAQSNMNPDALRSYGKAMLEAWVNTAFLESDATP